jgi:hypothetical protein
MTNFSCGMRFVAAVVLATSFVGGRVAARPDAGTPSVDLDLHRPPKTDPAAAPSGPPVGAQLARVAPAAPLRYQLRPLPGGGYTYLGPKFEARVASDGSVAFTSRRVVASPDPESAHLAGRDPTLADGSVVVGGGPAVHFDLNDEYMRILGRDPSRDAKADFLANTFDLRMKMALDARRNLERATLVELPSRLDQLWADPHLSPAERRHLLRALYDETNDRPDAAGARAVFRDFARKHLSKKEAAEYQ